jgi:hypothetical protein
MVRTLHALTLLVALALFLVLRVPYAVRAGGGSGPPETAAAALEAMARPQGSALLGTFEPTRPLLPPLVLFGAYAALVEVGAGGEGVRDGASFAARAASGSPVAVRAGAALWIVVEALLLAALVALTARVGALLSMPPWVAGTAATLFVVAPLALSGARRLDPAMLAGLLALSGLLFALSRPGADDHWRWLVGGVLFGAAISAHPLGLVLLPLSGLVFAVHSPREGIVRCGIALVAAIIGVLVGDPRLVEAPGTLLGRFDAAALSAPALGHVGAGERLLDGLTPLPLILAALGLVATWRLGRPGRSVALSLGAPVVLVSFLPAPGLSGVLLIVPLAAALAAFGAGHLLGGRGRRLGIALLVASIAWPAVRSLGETTKIRRGESRAAAASWLRTELPDDAAVVTDFYGPEIPGDHVTFTLPFDAERPEIYAGAYELGWYDGFDTFVLVGTQVERYRRDPSRYAPQLAFIDRLRATCERVVTFDRRTYAGPTIEVLRRRGTPSGSELSRLLRRLPIEPPIPEFYLSLGTAYERLGRLDDAKGFLTIAAHLVPGDPRLAVNLSGIYIDEGRYMQADSLLELAVHASPTNAKLRYQFGLVKQQRQRFGDAIGEYKMATRYDPTYVEAFFNLAICYFEVGNFSGARNAFRRVTELAEEGRMRSEAQRMIEELDAL